LQASFKFYNHKCEKNICPFKQFSAINITEIVPAENQFYRQSEGMMDKYLVSEDTQGIALPEEASLFKAACIDPIVFNGLYMAYIRPIYRYIFSKVGEVRQAEDLTAQVFLAVLESLPRYHHEGHFAAWLFSIARHKVADHYRSQRGEVPIEETLAESGKTGDPLTTVIQTEEAQQISKLIHQLDEQDQELLRLRFVASLGFGEIARLINSNMEATKKRIYRLLANLRQQLEHDHD
jgi:RNA polymerase sigma-70 factor, ECF subfamily